MDSSNSLSTSDPHIGLTVAESTDRMDDLHKLFQEVEAAYQAAASTRYQSPAEVRLRASLQKMRACLDGDYQTLWRLSQVELEEVKARAKRVTFAVPGSTEVTPKPLLEMQNTIVTVVATAAVQKPVAVQPQARVPSPAPQFAETSPATEAAHTRKFTLRALPLELGNPTPAFVDSPV
jgi:hypothetical protein